MTDLSSPFVTVVSGLPRSGTSMMMQMLAAGGLEILTDQQRVADDDNLQGYYELEAVKQTRQDPTWLQQAPGKAVKVIYRLLEDLPCDYHYRVLFMLRPLPEVIASQSVMLERRGTKGADISSDQLQKIFAGELQRVQSWLDAQENFAWTTIEYPKVLADATHEAKRVSQFLECALDIAGMADQVNQQLYRQRK